MTGFCVVNLGCQLSGSNGRTDPAHFHGVFFQNVSLAQIYQKSLFDAILKPCYNGRHMLSIRLQRVGRKNEPTFRVVLTDSKNGPKSGKSLEVLGAYDSRRAEKATLNADRIKYWIAQGAKPSGTMHNFLVTRKVIEGKKVNVLSKKSPIKKETKEGEAAPTAASAQAASAPAPTPAPEAAQ